MSNSKFVKDALRTESLQYNPVDPRILHAAMGLVTEAAEALDAIKKAMFYGKELDVTNLKEEVGDGLWYNALMVDALDSSFEEEQDRVIAKLKARYPHKFDSELAAHRNLAVERGILENPIRRVPAGRPRVYPNTDCFE